MNEQIKQAILNKIKEYNRIIISCHIRPDGDAIGSTKGLQGILQATYPKKEVYLVNPESSEYMAYLGADTDNPADELYADALVIVLDTATIDRTSNKKVLLGKELIKIDHHIDIKPYGTYSWVEDQRSSVCEMIADFYNTFRDELIITEEAATCLYSGMVTDSGRFRFSSTSGETMRLAAVLLDCDIDLDMIYANLYLEDYDTLKFRAWVYRKMQLSPNGVAYIKISLAMQNRFGLSREDASNAVTHLSAIKNSIIWIAFIENDDKTIRVRLRSRFVTINKLAEKYGGGGHAQASGATVKNNRELKALVDDADELIKTYKATNSGWL